MAKYSDLESGENETIQLTTNKKVIIQDAGCKQKACWWCMILCPIGVAIAVCILLTLFFLNQLKERDSMDDKVIVISRPWVIYGTDIINCTPEEPCEMTCHDYKIKSGNEASECEFNSLWAVISGLILGICGLVILCPLLNLCIGYICHPSETTKKTTPKKVVPQYART